MWTTIFLRMLRNILKDGTLKITLPDGRSETFGDGSGTPVEVKISDPALFRKFVISPHIAIGEAYMDGTLTIGNDDLYGLLRIGARNMRNPNGYGLQQYFVWLSGWLRQINPVGRARRNVAHHYDLSGALYDLFLDADKQYSCAYFRDPGLSLEEAQSAKKDHIARKLCLGPDMRVLDIGCGWGGMALTLARDHGVRVVGVTLSEEQHKVANERVREAGLEDRIDIRLQDYRKVGETFDRIVSVGMFEHVGAPHYREYFRHVREMLTGDGVALIHTIGRCAPPSHVSTWTTRYIFPGGHLPAMSEALQAIEKERLWTVDVEVWRLHYAETLKIWRERFMANIDKAREIYDERFCRMWRLYLIGAEMSFRENRNAVFQFQLARRKDAVPLTREYLYSGTGA